MAFTGSRVSLKFKIIIAFVAVVPIIICIGAVSWIGLSDVNRANYENGKVTSIMRGILDANACAKDFRIKSEGKYIEAFNALAASVSNEIDEYRQMLESETLRSHADKTKAGFESLRSLFREVIKNQESIKKLTDQLNAAVKEFTDYADTAFRTPLSERQNMAFINGEQLGASVAEVLALVNRASETFYEIQATYLSSFLSASKDSAAADSARQRMAKIFGDLRNIGKILEAEEKRNDVLPAIENLAKKYGGYDILTKDLAKLFENDELLLKQMAEKEAGILSALKQMLAESAERIASVKSSSEMMLLALIIASLIVQLFLSWLTTRAIVRPLDAIISKLGSASEQVSEAAGQLSTASQAVADAASRQAASIEETSSSLEEMSSMTNQNANNADQAKLKMAEAKEVVDKVNHHMEDMARSMEEITVSSNETGKIIKTIDEIAFQTNLLALNAAVEAARAGEAGAGFAVVADEVRNLAMRAAEAARNTSSLIENTIKAVHAGTELTNATKLAFKENIAIAAKVGELVTEVSAASSEQAQGIAQINKAVVEMDRVVQQVAANSEESASSSEEMSAQAEEMNALVEEMIAFVKGGRGGSGKRPASGLAPAGRAPSSRLGNEFKGKPRTLIGPSIGSEGKEIKPRQVIPLDDEEV